MRRAKQAKTRMPAVMAMISSGLSMFFPCVDVILCLSFIDCKNNKNGLDMARTFGIQK